MTKHRITLVRDDGVAGYYSNEEWINQRREGRIAGFSIERTEKLVDPPIVQEFRVKITSPADVSPAHALTVHNALTARQGGLLPARTIEVVTI